MTAARRLLDLRPETSATVVMRDIHLARMDKTRPVLVLTRGAAVGVRRDVTVAGITSACSGWALRYESANATALTRISRSTSMTCGRPVRRSRQALSAPVRRPGARRCWPPCFRIRLRYGRPGRLNQSLRDGVRVHGGDPGRGDRARPRWVPWPTRHAVRAAVIPVRILGSGTAVEMTASPGWE